MRSRSRVQQPTTPSAPIASAALGEGVIMPLAVAGWPVLLARIDGRALAVVNRCTHAGSALDEGRLRRGAIMCPLHGARFDLASGRCLGGPYAPLTTLRVDEADAWITVHVPAEPPAAEHLPVMPV